MGEWTLPEKVEETEDFLWDLDSDLQGISEGEDFSMKTNVLIPYRECDEEDEED
jgi:hypothetical protein